MKNAILYVRVSTDEQASRGFSLRDQEEKLLQYCKDNNYNVLNIYREDHSAKTFNRPEFNKLITYCKTHHKIVDELLFIKWDRFSRNTAESYNKINFFNSLAIRSNAISQPLDLSIPEQGLMLAVYLSIPEVENQRRSQNVIAGMRRAFKEGRYVSTPPKGYKMGRDASEKPILVPNSDAKYIQEAFELLSTGIYNLNEVFVKLKKKGFKSSSSAFSRTVRNPLYSGRVFLKEYKEEPAKLIDGIHEPLVTQKMFDTVQDIVNGRRKHLGTRHKKVNPKFPLRGFIMCPSCNKTLSASTSKGRNKEYSYYHCFSPCAVRIKTENAHAWFDYFLKSISLDSNAYELLLKIIKAEFKKIDSQSVLGPKHYQQIESIKTKLIRIQDLYVDGDLDREEYQKVKTRYQNMLTELDEKEQQLQKKQEVFNLYKNGLKLIEGIDNQYNTSDIDLKRRLIGSIFPEKFQFEKNKVRTADVNPILFKITKFNKGYRRNKKRDKSKKVDLSQLVLKAGLEPARPLLTTGF